MRCILGIDPGSRILGFGIIHFTTTPRYVTSGVIRMAATNTLDQRLKQIFEGIQTLIETHKPTEMAVEQVFMHRNANSALKLGQARGAAITAGSLHGLAFNEYAARYIKQAVVGYGNAEKAQVQFMVTQLLQLSATPSPDAADALAIALCHCHHIRLNSLIQQAKG